MSAPPPAGLSLFLWRCRPPAGLSLVVPSRSADPGAELAVQVQCWVRLSSCGCEPVFPAVVLSLFAQLRC
eukprot:914299-Pelagomonas_calceolata.AAC.1